MSTFPITHPMPTAWRERKPLCGAQGCARDEAYLCQHCSGIGYCSQSCEEAHEPIHKIQCKPTMNTCGKCKRRDPDLFSCGQCNGIMYCSKMCEDEDKPFHKLLCKTFAQSPRPESSSETFRRIILLHPKKAEPEIVWVLDTPRWSITLLQSVLDRQTPPKPMTELVNLCHIPHRPIVGHHTDLISRDSFLTDGSAHNEALATTMMKAGLLGGGRVPRNLKGPIIVARRAGRDKWGEYHAPYGGPKLMDATVEDFTDTLKWLCANPSAEVHTEEEDYLLHNLAALNLCQGYVDGSGRAPKKLWGDTRTFLMMHWATKIGAMGNTRR